MGFLCVSQHRDDHPSFPPRNVLSSAAALLRPGSFAAVDVSFPDVFDFEADVDDDVKERCEHGTASVEAGDDPCPGVFCVG